MTKTWETGEIGGQVQCETCGEMHEGEYHHEGTFGEGPIFAVTCGLDGLTDWFTLAGLFPVEPRPAAASLGLVLR